VNKPLLSLAWICSLCIISGCAGGGGSPPSVLTTHFSVTPATSPTAGTSFSFTVTALGASSQTATSYAGTVHFTSTDPQASLPAASMMTSVTGTFSATLKTAGSQTITVTDSNSLSGSSNSIGVSPGAATHFSVTGPTAASAGVQFVFTLTALDAYNNIAIGYSGMVHFSSSDAQAVLPANTTLTNGTGTFPATLKAITNTTIIAADSAISTINSSPIMISVVSNAPTHFAIVTPGSVTTRKSFGVAVTAQDAINNVSAGYSGTVQFTSTDSQAHLPASSPLTSGVGNFSAAFENAGAQTITTTDTVQPSLTGASSSITVSAAAALAISSGAPPSGTFGVLYGPGESELFECFGFRSACVPCSSGRTRCVGLADCNLHLGFPCVSLRTVQDGFQLAATGGVLPYVWSATGLPPGLSVGSQTGEIFGTPTSPGGYNFPVTVTDSGTPPVMTPMSYTVTINDPAPPVINVTPAPPSGVVNLPYSFTFTAASTATPLMWRVSAGTPPPGPMLNPDGVFSGTPTATGTSSFTLIAEDSFKQDSMPQDFTIQIFAHGFAPTGAMAGPRIAHTATLLSSGEVLVAGGTDGSGTPIATAELYDPTHGTFSPTGSMATARAHYAATLLCDLSAPPCNDKRVLVTGGLDINGNPLMSAELYDPTNGTFSTTGLMQFVHASHTATLLKTGKVLIIGWGPATAELFDPSTGTFKATGSMLEARVSHTATLLTSGKVLVTGGISGAPPTTTVLSEAELYDPTTGSFSATLGPMANARQWHTASLLANGKVLVAGGMLDNADTATATAELFDPATQMFTATKGSMVAARGFHTATALQDGTVLESGGDDRAATLASAEVYDPTAETFSPTGSMGSTRESHTATLLNNGTVLVNGGVGSGEATAELYQ
jgi:hypothetical protein